MMNNANVKSNVINNIMLAMSEYLERTVLDVLQKVIEEQFVFLNMEQITTLPATVEKTADEQNKYLLDLMMIKKRNLAEGTKQQYKDCVKRLTGVIDKPLIKMDEVDIDYYLRWYEQRNVASGGKRNQASTCNNERRFLSAFFTWLRKEKFISYNPVEAIEPKKEIRKPIDYFRPAQMEELRDGCESLRDRAIVEVLRSTGARVGEIPQINREDIDWQTGDVLIYGEKGGKYRMMYIDEVARFHLRRYLDARTDGNPALFVWNKAPYNRLQKTGIRAALKQIGKREQMECRVYPHKLRKTLGMSLKNSGVDIGTIQEVLGHSSPAVTSRYYAESTPETLRSVRMKAIA